MNVLLAIQVPIHDTVPVIIHDTIKTVAYIVERAVPKDSWSIVDIAQIATAVSALAAVGISLWFSKRTLKEIETDRKLSRRPLLMFPTGSQVFNVYDYGGYLSSIQIVNHNGGGMDKAPFLKVENCGEGPSVNGSITWKVNRVSYDRLGNNIDIPTDPSRLKEFKKEHGFSDDSRAYPFSSLRSGEAYTLEVPDLISRNYKNGPVFMGTAVLAYEDVLSHKYVTCQPFVIVVERWENEVRLSISFEKAEHLH